MKKNNIKLYNLIFPIWLLWLFPITWFSGFAGKSPYRFDGCSCYFKISENTRDKAECKGGYF